MLLKVPRVIKGWKSPDFYEQPTGKYSNHNFGRRVLICESAPFKMEAFAAFGLDGSIPEPVNKNFIGNHYLDGAGVQLHRDSAPEGYVHTRCNWMLKKPEAGGDPVFDGEVVRVDAGDLWICFANLEMHGSTRIQGGERLIYSFGALIPLSQLEHVL